MLLLGRTISKMKSITIIVLSALLAVFCTSALRQDVQFRMDCSRSDCAAHRKLWKDSQNGTYFKKYLSCLDDCVNEKLHGKEKGGPPSAASARYHYQ